MTVDCNFYYSLLGIETSVCLLNKGLNKEMNCNFYYSLLGIETPTTTFDILKNGIAISITPYQGLKHFVASKVKFSITIAISITPYQGLKRDIDEKYRMYYDYCNFYYSLLGIETLFNISEAILRGLHCNFYYSLLGIETVSLKVVLLKSFSLQFLLLPIRD